MKSPITGKEMKLVKENTTLPFRKEVFPLVYHSYVCVDSEEQFTSNELDHINQIQIYNQYREKYGIPFPEEIQAVRKKYKVSASKMSEILGLGIHTYRQYESGEIPSVANGRLILAIKQPEEFVKQVKASFHILNEKESKKFIETAESIEREESESIWEKIFERKIFQCEAPNEFSGYKTPNFEKISNVISYLSDKTDLYKTKLNKLLFYSDFRLYQLTGSSMTGITYRAIEYGPVPREYEKLYLKLCDDEKIKFEEVLFDNGNVGEMIRSRQPFNSDSLTEDERKNLNNVLKAFKGMNTRQIVDVSHKERAWYENKDEKKIISYQKYAYDLMAL